MFREKQMYRLAADVFNDLAMVLDCLSPALPKTARVLTLSGSSVLRALCGVAAGSSKASLSAHFARRDNLGELNAVSLWFSFFFPFSLSGKEIFFFFFYPLTFFFFVGSGGERGHLHEKERWGRISVRTSVAKNGTRRPSGSCTNLGVGFVFPRLTLFYDNRKTPVRKRSFPSWACWSV